MEKLKTELKQRGKDIHFVAINGQSAKDDVTNLTDDTTFPILQDSDGEEGWKAVGGSKDDFYIYDSKGVLAVHLPFSGTWATNLAEEGGWQVLNSVLDVVQ